MDRRRSLLAAALLAVLGCDDRPAGPRHLPVPLVDADQMTAYLSDEGRAWVPNDASAHRWRFGSDGRFELWLDGAPGADLEDELGEPAFDGARRIEGRWEATTTTLTLREVAGAGVLSFPLAWVDGRRRIEIAGVRYKSQEEDDGASSAL